LEKNINLDSPGFQGLLTWTQGWGEGPLAVCG
jgi:hypothetical protein